MNPSLLRPTRQLAASFFSRGTYSPNMHHCTRLHISFSPTPSRKGRLQASAVNSRAGDAACFLHSLTASLETSRAVACQGRLRMAERVLPLPQPSSSTRDPAGRSGMGGGAPFHRRPFSLYSSSQARRCSGRDGFTDEIDPDG